MEYVLIQLSYPEKKMKSTHFQTRASLGVLSPCDMTNHGGEGGAYMQENRNKAYALGGG